MAEKKTDEKGNEVNTDKEKKERKKLGKKRKKLTKQEMQVRMAVIFMITIILVVIFIQWLSVELRKFDYAGLEFVKTKQENLILYQTRFPVKNNLGKTVGYITAYFREDPRNLEDIEIREKIKLKISIGIATDQKTIKCEDSLLAGSTLALFFNEIGAEPYAATTNKTESKETNIPYLDCADETKTGIVYRKSDENIIRKEDSCYILNIADCNIMNVTERFIIASYAHSNNIEI